MVKWPQEVKNMKKLFPNMLDRPDGPTVAAGFLYGLAAFVAVPYILFWFVLGMNDDRATLTTIELIYHAVNCVLAVTIFRGYLKESFLYFQVDAKNCILTALIGVLLMLLWTAAVFFLGCLNMSKTATIAALAILPLPEMELQILAGEQIFYSPILGTLSMVLLVPVSVSCLYYAVGFAPLAEKRPWMGYAFLMLVAAIPRIVNMLTFWPAGPELMLYAFQLPVHLIACWTYQKTDTVWTPILTLAGANLTVCLCRLALFGVA